MQNLDKYSYLLTKNRDFQKLFYAKLITFSGDWFLVVPLLGLVYELTNNALITNLGIEKEINTFSRLQNPSIHLELRKAFPDLPEELDNKTVFLKLRELRNIC